MTINVRRFTRASPSSITFASGSWDAGGIESVFNSDFAMAAIIRLKSVGVEQVLIDCTNSGGSKGTFHVDASNRLAMYTDAFGITSHSDTLTLAVDTWYLVGVTGTGAGGLGTMRFHRFTYGGAWTHIDGSAETFYGNNDATTFRVGDNQGTGGPTGALDAEVLIAGISPTGLTDGNFETLEDDGTGGTFTDWLSLMGTVWRFNQAANTTDVLDLDTFNADETAESNTTVVAVTEPTGWGEDAGGGGGAPKLATIQYRMRRVA